MSLPLDILKMRVKNEVKMCIENLNHKIEVEDPEFKELPFRIYVTFINTPGPVLMDNKVTHVYTHKMMIKITKDYPYQKPIVKWETDIFHPNIVPPSRGGWVCTKLLDDWTFSSNLASFINGIESLLANPNPRSPYKDDTTLMAAKFFAKKAYKPPIIIKEKKASSN